MNKLVHKIFKCHSGRLMPAAALLIAFVGLYASATAQKTEHYDSPLYSPRTYDPNIVETKGLPPALKEVGIEQRLGEQLPLDTVLRDENGKAVRLGDYFSKGRPVILAFVYYECPMLCNQILNGLTGSLKGMSLDAGKDFDVVAISFDSREYDKPELAKNKKASYMERYGRPGTEGGWHFLTGTEDAIQTVTRAAGFGFKWDEKSNQFAHGGGIMVATPEGKLSRYLYGIDYAPRDLKYAVMESASERVGGPVEQLMLYCYHYDPSTGKYGLSVLRVMRLGGIATLLGLGAMVFVFWRRNKKREVADNE